MADTGGDSIGKLQHAKRLPIRCGKTASSIAYAIVGFACKLAPFVSVRIARSIPNEAFLHSDLRDDLFPTVDKCRFLIICRLEGRRPTGFTIRKQIRMSMSQLTRCTSRALALSTWPMAEARLVG